MRKLLLFSVILLLTIQSICTKSNYSVDGSYNHPVHYEYGQFNTHQLRLVTPSYDDNISVPYGGLPSRLQGTRHISNLLFGREAAGCRNLNPKFTSNILTYWGQFIDHDLSWTPDSSGKCEEFKIPVPLGDSFYDALGTGNKTMNFCRTVPVPGSGTNETNIRQFPNLITSWLDASMVYGSTNQSASALRTFVGGKMKTTDGPDGPQLPLNDDGKGNVLNTFMTNDAKRVPSNQLYLCGDVRCNENPVLTSLTTLFVREHNRRVDLLPLTMSDEEKYQEARRWVIAHIQAITFNEFLPTLTGSKVPAYKFDSSLNPQVSVFFSTVAFRYGHDQISGLLQRYDKNGLPIPEGHILLRDSYSFPFAVRSVGIGPYLRGASVTCQASPDAMLDEDLRTFLFDQSSALATDLAARNMQRARDHGIPSYNQCRKAFGLTPCETFECVNDDPNIVNLLNLAYGKDNVTFLDPFLGGLLEKKMTDSNLGQLFTTVIVDQLTRTRNADRYWYQNTGIFTKAELSEIENTKLSDIMKRNIETNSIPKDVFNTRDLSPYEALNHPTNNTRWIVPIIVLGSFATFLIFVILFLLIFLIRKRRPNNNDNEMK